MRTRRRSSLSLRTLAAGALLLVAGPAAPALAGPSGYHATKTIPLGPAARFDYLTLDPATRRLFVARDDRVSVVGLDTGRIVGEIPGTPGVHGVALAPELGRGFTSNGRAANVTVFDLATLKVLGTVPTDEGPDAIVYDPATKLVLTMNGRGRSATVIDAASGAVRGTLPLDGKPEFAVADGRGRIFANLEDRSAEVEIDPVARTIVHRWPLTPCVDPTGLAIDRAHRRLFVGCRSRVMAVVDADTGRVVATPRIGGGVDGTAFDPQTQLAFSSNGDGTLSVVREEGPDVFRGIEDVATLPGARTMTLDEATHEVALATIADGALVVLVYGPAAP